MCLDLTHSWVANKLFLISHFYSHKTLFIPHTFNVECAANCTLSADNRPLGRVRLEASVVNGMELGHKHQIPKFLSLWTFPLQYEKGIGYMSAYRIPKVSLQPCGFLVEEAGGCVAGWRAMNISSFSTFIMSPD